MAILVRLGYLVSSNTMAYGGVGAKTIRFEYNLFEKADKIPAPFSKQSLHLLTEIGIETFSKLVQNLAFRFSYSFMPQKDVTQKGKNFPINHIYRKHGFLKTSVTEHAIKVGLAYRF
ncbi:MAG: hypothetical protein K0R76_1676 [Alphaproteobacteria bacterium]|nr:hypothetical protein [Alphaproteobacteria bacterium]